LLLVCCLAGGLVGSSPGHAQPASPESTKSSNTLKDRLVFRGDGDAWVSLGGWLALDVVGFSRTEVEYGTSRHIEPVLASARISTEFQLNRNWGGRLDGEFAETNPSVQEAWFEFRRWKLLRLRAGRVKVPFGLAPQMTLPDYSLISAPAVFGNSKDFRDADVPVKGLSGYDVSGWYVEGLWRVWNHGAFPAVELAGRYERLDFGDGDRLVDTEAGTEDRSPLKDSWMDGITAGVNVRLAREVRLTLAWQGLRFGDPTMAPDAPLSPAPKTATDTSTEDPTTSPPSDSRWVHHFFLRLQFAI